jgi:hypothetical protein
VQSPLDFCNLLKTKEKRNQVRLGWSSLLALAEKVVRKEREEERMMSNIINKESASWLIALTAISRI